MKNGADERVAVTAAAASMLAALTLCPLVRGATWLFVAAILVIAVMVSGIIARQVLRWWPAIAAVQAAVLLFTVTLLFARSQFLDGPNVLLDLYTAGMKVTQQQAPPVEATQGIVLLVAGSTGLVALLVDVLATTLRQPALAGLPLLAVYCVPAALLDGGLPGLYFFAAAIGFLLLLSADAGDRVRGWGRVLTSVAGGRTGENQRRRPSDGGMARGGRRVGVATVLVAMVLPATVPGLSNRIIGGSGEGDGSGKGRTITRLNPILDLRKDLQAPSDTPLLTYRTDVTDPQPLRIVTSDLFDGNTWAPSTSPIPKSHLVQNGLPAPPGLTSEVKTVQVSTKISIGPLRETYLPLPYPATKVLAAGTWLYDSNTLNVIGDGQTTENLSYEVAHLDVEPTARQLADAPATGAGLAGAQYLALPKNLPSVIASTALQIAKTGTDYQRAVRLQRWFRDDGGFQYSVNAPPVKQGDSSADAMVAFLKDKQGYCVHFATTMATMARTLGIPARVAVGFLPGERDAKDASGHTMVITSHDAHAWPELFFAGVGWVRFEPTPRGSLATPPAWSVPPAGVLPEDPAPSKTTKTEPSSAASASSAPTVPKKRPQDEQQNIATSSGGSGVPWRTLLIVLAVLLVAAAPRLTVLFSTRRRWRRATGSPTELAEAAWDDLRLGLSDLSVRWAASWTPRAVQQRLGTDYRLEPEQLAGLDRLVAEIEAARYAPPPADGDPGRTAQSRAQDVAGLISAVSATKSGRTRWQARLWPASGVAMLSRFGPWVNSAADRAGRQASAVGSQVRDKVGAGKR